jgi:hypothetical protein
MKLLLITTAGLVATSIAVARVAAQTGGHAPESRLRDSGLTWQLFLPDSAKPLFGRDSILIPDLGRVAAVKRLTPAVPICPMPVAVVDINKRDPMPVGRPDATWADRMPIARNNCANPRARTFRP